MADERVFSGGCLCGQLRYEARGLIEAGYCHCRLCQRSSGAPVLAWAGFPTATFSQRGAEPVTFHSSESGRRDFCPSCGTPVAFRDTRSPERIDLNVGSLDDPASIEPVYHIWIGSRVPWMQIADDLPRYEDDGPEPAAP